MLPQSIVNTSIMQYLIEHIIEERIRTLHDYKKSMSREND